MQVDGHKAAPRRWLVTPDVRRTRLTGGYSRFVGLMRWLLPVGAAILAAALIAWPYLDSRNDGFAMIMSDLEVDNTGRLSMHNARFVGTDESGQPYTVTTDEAWQDPAEQDVVYLGPMQGDISLTSGAWIAVSALSGKFDRLAETLVLEQDVSVFTDEGYELHTEKAEFDLGLGTGWGDEPVYGQGPAGLLEAEGFRLSQDDGKIHFIGRVHMTLYPGSTP